MTHLKAHDCRLKRCPECILVPGVFGYQCKLKGCSPALLTQCPKDETEVV